MRYDASHTVKQWHLIAVSTPGIQVLISKEHLQSKEPRLFGEMLFRGRHREKYKINLEQFVVNGQKIMGTYQKNVGSNLKGLPVVKTGMIRAQIDNS